MNHNQSNADPTIRREVTLREIILLIREYVIYLWRQKWWLLLFVILGAVLFAARSYGTANVYGGRLTFIVNDSQSGGGVGGILGQFGLGGSQGGVNIPQVIQMAQSRRISSEVLFDSITLNGRKDFIANHLIDLYDYHEIYRESGSTSLADFYFTQGNVADFSPLENTMYKTLHYRVNAPNDPLMTILHSAETGIVTISVTTVNEELTLELLNRFYEELNNFYRDNAAAPQQKTIEKLQFQADSLAAVLKQQEYRIAAMEDRSLGVIDRVDRVSVGRLQREANLTSGIYTEVLKNIQTSRFMLSTAQPVFQVMDAPSLPLYGSGVSLKALGIRGAIFGAFFGIFLLVCIRIYRDVVYGEAIDRISIE